MDFGQFFSNSVGNIMGFVLFVAVVCAIFSISRMITLIVREMRSSGK